MYNLNLFFNKIYYQNLGSKAFAEDLNQKNDILFNSLFSSEDYNKFPLDALREQLEESPVLESAYPGYTCFYMETCYPGLLVGTGYSHGSGEADEDIKLGFSFDYTTGQPYIPGSTVKGVLKSAFAHPEIIATKISVSAIPAEVFGLLEDDIFENNRDIFLDAVIFRGDKDGKILGQDYITPHKELTKNPTPLQFLKILPDVCFEFRFILADSVIEKDGKTFTFKAEEKRDLFICLLETFGIGAKTNVGYGALKEVKKEEIIDSHPFPNDSDVAAWIQSAVSTASATVPQKGRSNNQPAHSLANGDHRENRPPTYNAQQVCSVSGGAGINIGDVVDGIVIRIEHFGAFVKISNTGKTGLIHSSEIINGNVENIEDYLHINDSVKVKVISIQHSPKEKIGLSLKQV